MFETPSMQQQLMAAHSPVVQIWTKRSWVSGNDREDCGLLVGRANEKIGFLGDSERYDSWDKHPLDPA